MPKSINSSNLTAAQDVDVWPVDFVKVIVDPNDSDKKILLTNHFQDVTFGGDTYISAAQFLAFSTIAEDLDVKDNSISVSLSGIGSVFTAIVLDNNIEGATVELFRGFFNKTTGVFVADPQPRWSGLVNNFNIAQNYTGSSDDTISISLDCKSLLSTILGRVNGRYTSSDGVSDKSMDFVPGLRNFNPQFGKE